MLTGGCDTPQCEPQKGVHTHTRTHTHYIIIVYALGEMISDIAGIPTYLTSRDTWTCCCCSG